MYVTPHKAARIKRKMIEVKPDGSLDGVVYSKLSYKEYLENRHTYYKHPRVCGIWCNDDGALIAYKGG